MLAYVLNGYHILIRETMGITYIDLEIANRGGDKTATRFLVDSGAGYSVLPLATWKALALIPERVVSVSLADGRELKRNASQCEFYLMDTKAFSPVILGEEGDEALLGAVTLENLGFVLNPLQRKLEKMQIRL